MPAGYSGSAKSVATLLPDAAAYFFNPYDQTVGLGCSWEDLPSVHALPSAIPGIVSYADSGQATYVIRGRGLSAPISLVLAPGR